MNNQDIVKKSDALEPSLNYDYNFQRQNISYLWIFDLYGPVRDAFDAGRFITRASGRGLEIETFFEP